MAHFGQPLPRRTQPLVQPQRVAGPGVALRSVSAHNTARRSSPAGHQSVPVPSAGQSQYAIDPQRPYHNVMYSRDQPFPAPLSAAPDLVSASLYEGHNQDMLYVHCVIGSSGVQQEMLVDTGAQMSVISLPMVRRLGLVDFIDTSSQGVASGVGQARILGKLCGVPVRLGSREGVEFALDFMVLGINQEMLMLGIDQMRRFECIIDLQRQCLVFGGYGGTDVAFVPPEERHVQWRSLCPMM